jgi:S1-C subfamily serine protease
MRVPPALLASLMLAMLSSVASAQFERAREALAQVEVIDAAFHQAQQIMRKQIPIAKKEEELRKLKVKQEFRLLVSGVAVGPQEVVTRALHPRARLRIMVTFSNGKQAEARILGNDPRSNLALIQTETPAPAFLEPIEAQVAAAERTYLVGHRGDRALEADGIVTDVSIGATCKDIYGVRAGKALEIGSVFVVATTGRRIYPGAACLDSEGRLIGILLGCAPPQAMPKAAGALADMERSFVIPGRRILKVLAALRAHGRVIRADFGLGVAPVSSALRAQLPDVPGGAGTVDRLDEHGPAAKAGLRRNDILLRVDGTSAGDIHRLRERLCDCEPGKAVKLEVLRAGEKLEMRVTPVESKD